MKINISPVLIFPDTATQLEIVEVRVILGEVASLEYRLLDANSQLLRAKRLALGLAQINSWKGGGDAALLTAVATRIGLTPA